MKGKKMERLIKDLNKFSMGLVSEISQSKYLELNDVYRIRLKGNDCKLRLGFINSMNDFSYDIEINYDAGWVFNVYDYEHGKDNRFNNYNEILIFINEVDEI